MPVAFPLARQAFWDRLPAAEVTFDLRPSVSVSRTGGGALLTRELGEPRWAGSVTFGRATRAEVAEVEALLNLLRLGGRTFHAWDLRRPYPLAYPGGAGLPSADPTIRAFGPDPRELALGNMVAGATISAGDYLGFAVPGGRALHQAVTGATANGAGDTPLFEVVPPLRAGATVGQSVDFVRPVCTAQVVPGTYAAPSSRRTIVEGMAFEWEETL
jgi:hypothetical protein